MEQHYIPRFYLEGFCDPDPPPRYTPYLWVFGKSERRWHRRAPRNVATRPDYYDFTDLWGNRQPFLEHVLQVVGSGVAPILGTKIASCEPLTAADREYLAGFLGLMMTRTPRKLAQLANVCGEITRHRFRKRLRYWSQHRDEWAEFIRGFNA